MFTKMLRMKSVAHEHDGNSVMCRLIRALQAQHRMQHIRKVGN